MQENGQEFGNNLLNVLRPADRAILVPMLAEWNGKAGTIIHEKGDDVRYAYFPRETALVSHIVVLKDGRTAEIAPIGREGALGGIVSRGRLPAFSRAEVRFSGPFYRVSLVDLEAAKAQSPSLNYLFTRYSDCLMAQVFQSVACSSIHPIEQRTARWLLAALERTGNRALPLTQEELASMLGVGRSYISRTLNTFRARGMISMTRGRLRIDNEDLLRSIQCECNGSVSSHFHDVLEGVYPNN